MDEVIEVKRRHTFTVVMDDVVDDDNVDKHMLLVYVALLRFADKQRACFPSYATLATKARLSRRATIDAVERLVNVGIVSKQSSKNAKDEFSHNTYIVNDDWGGSARHALGGGARHALGSAPHAPEVDTSKNKQKERDSLSHVPKDEREEVANDGEHTTTDIPTITTEFDKIADAVNKATSWTIPFDAGSARSRLMALREDGLSDDDIKSYCLYVAERESCAKNLMRAIGLNTHLESWREWWKQENKPIRYCVLCGARDSLSGDRCTHCGNFTTATNEGIVDVIDNETRDELRERIANCPYGQQYYQDVSKFRLKRIADENYPGLYDETVAEMEAGCNEEIPKLREAVAV